MGIAAIMLLVVAGFAMATPAEAYTYNRDATVQYALNNAYNEVPGSWYFYPRGGDCTNFISWSLYAGGWQKRHWWDGGDEWYMDGNPWPYSKSWTVVTDFGNFVKKYRGSQLILGDNPDAVKSRLSDWIKKGIIRKGDLIQRLPGTYSGHTMIITEVDRTTGKAKVTYHSTGTDNKRNWPFDDFMSQYPSGSFVVYALLDSNYY